MMKSFLRFIFYKQLPFRVSAITHCIFLPVAYIYLSGRIFHMYIFFFQELARYLFFWFQFISLLTHFTFQSANSYNFPVIFPKDLFCENKFPVYFSIIDMCYNIPEIHSYFYFPDSRMIRIVILIICIEFSTFLLIFTK